MYWKWWCEQRDQSRFIMALSCWVLKTSKDGLWQPLLATCSCAWQPLRWIRPSSYKAFVFPLCFWCPLSPYHSLLWRTWHWLLDHFLTGFISHLSLIFIYKVSSTYCKLLKRTSTGWNFTDAPIQFSWLKACIWGLKNTNGDSMSPFLLPFFLFYLVALVLCLRVPF